jgi:DNA-binding transcriptional regulator YiaG
MASYHYRACGLDNVILEGLAVGEDDAGETIVTIPAIGRLHKVIATMVITKTHALTGKELRFLRTELGLTQTELANVLRREALTISRWERGENPIEATADALIRLLANESLALGLALKVADVTQWTLPNPISPSFRIDGSDPGHYRPVAA